MRRVWVKVVAALLCLCVLSSACSAIAWFRRAKVVRDEVVKSSVMVFPFDSATDVQMSEPIAKALADAAREKLQKTGKYQVVVFSERLAPIQRAVEVDQVLKADQVKGPFGEDTARLVQLAQIADVDYVLTGIIDSYTIDPSGKSVSVVLSAQLIDGKNGKVVSAYTATGKSSEAVPGIDPNDLRATALADGIAKLGLDRTEGDEGTTK